MPQTVELTPGLYKECGDCRKQLKDGPFPESFPCKAAWAPNGFLLQPKIEVGADGSIICDRYKPNLETFIKTLQGKIPALLRAVELSLPR